MANSKRELFQKRRMRVRSKLRRNARGRLRMSVHRSSKNLSVQIIDDTQGVTLASASTEVTSEPNSRAHQIPEMPQPVFYIVAKYIK